MNRKKLQGLYVITDDQLTPKQTIIDQVTQAIEAGASIVQLRNKSDDENFVESLAVQLQKICTHYGVLFVLNDKVEMAIKIKCDGLHIGKSDHHRFDQIRKEFGGIIGVSCYGDVGMAKEFESKGADYVAFGSFFHSPTKPSSNIVNLKTLYEAKSQLKIPVCAIGGINTQNLQEVLSYNPDIVSVISDIWNSQDIASKVNQYIQYM
ncbi:MAG: thiamine phosphate synthase [Campylobacterales bacterium]|nr:thiamine phosphate synthase [Campylobacterales bacterium]